MTDLLFIRVLFVALIACAAYFLRPFDLNPPVAAAMGAAVGVAVVIFEIRIKHVSLKRLIGAAFGSLLGICGAYLICLVIDRALPSSHDTGHFLQLALLALMTLLRPGGGRGQGRHAEPGGAGRPVRRRKGDQEYLQNSGHQRDYRRPHRRYRRDRIRRRHPGDSAVRAARAATGGGFLRFDEAQSRPARTGYSAANPEDAAVEHSDSGRRFSRTSGKWT